jgi:signal transduction histidine kinase
MKRWLPRTLFGQMVLILLAGLLVSHLVGTLIFASDRARAVRAIGGYAATQRIANLARLVDEAPAPWRARIVAAASDPTLLVTLSPQPPAFAAAATDADSQPIERYLAEQLPAPLAEHLHVAVSAALTPPGFPAGPPGAGYGPHMAMGGRATGDGPMSGTPMGGTPMGGMTMGGVPMGGPPWMAGFGGRRGLQAAVRLSDGAWLTFIAALPGGGPAAPWPFIAALAVMAVVVVLASVWAVGRVTAPLGMLARAAERLGRDVNAPPIAEAGTREMRQAAQSFNQMQQRILRLVDNRTRMLAALSHDLRTPLTLLRLRTEGMREAEERERMLATIGELDAMVGASLSFARDQATTEPWRRTDLAALVASIVDDMADAGLPVTLAPAEPVVLECQPGALRRALVNLIDNAIKYGKTARVALAATAATVSITIDDDGPGIPEGELQRVFEPFFRLEQSRSRETGGSGLGLSIALSIVQAHGGEITLANRAPATACAGPSGLRASILLPRQG